MKNTTKTENSLDGLKKKMEMTEERVNKFEHRLTERKKDF